MRTNYRTEDGECSALHLRIAAQVRKQIAGGWAIVLLLALPARSPQNKHYN